MISQLYTQVLQLRKESLKKIRACTGFELLTSAIPVPRFIPIKLTKRRKFELRPAFTRSQTGPPDRSLKINEGFLESFGFEPITAVYMLLGID